MKPIYVYPGTFSPPTFGRLSIVYQAAALFPEIIILCSENPEKKEVWFTPEECKELWKTYVIPKNVIVMTQAEFKHLFANKTDMVIIRGLRNDGDLEQETKVMLLNRSKFGIKKYFYIFGTNKNQKISSSRVRREVTNLNLKNLSHQVSPLVISSLLEKALMAQNIFLVVGRPGSGKSTILRNLSQINPNNYWINTDGFNQQLKPLLKEVFGEEDLINVALKDEEKMKKVIAKAWLKLLIDSLKKAPSGSNIFIEIAYGLQADKLMFRFIGGKIIYIGCGEKQNLERVISRGTPQLSEFIKKIPDLKETAEIVEKYQLSASYIDTDCSIDDVYEKTKTINNLILGGIKNAYDL